MKKQQHIPTNSARYWRTRYAQLQSDFEELLAVNQTLALRNAALEGLPSHLPRSPRWNFHFTKKPTTTKSKTTKGKKS